MKRLLFVLNLLFVGLIRCHNSESSELNSIDDNPFYDTIIFRDIADVLNEFENHVNPPIDAFINSDSESGEDIEELLSEYQHYLDKAEKQRKAYTDKSKHKNKIPLILQEKYVKTKPGMSSNYNKYYFKGDYYNKQSFKYPEIQNSNPIDLFIPLNSKTKYLSKSEVTTVLPKDNRHNKFDEIILNEKKIKKDLPQIIYRSSYEPNKSSCFCKNNRMPCDCKCKQCMISLDSFPGQYTERTNMYDDKKPFRNPFLSGSSFKGPDYALDDKAGDNMYNFRIKIDVSMPKTSFGFENLLKNFNRGLPMEYDNGFYKAINIPFPFYNFPIPKNMVGFNKLTKFNKHDGLPFHKMTIQKKRKAKVVNSNGKQHRKKLITIHNIKLEPQLFTNHFEDTYNISETNNKFVKPSFMPNVTENISILLTTEKPYENQSVKENPEDTIYLMVNITSNTNNDSDVHKNNMSAETNSYEKSIVNLTTDKPIINTRLKRAIWSATNNSSIVTTNLSVLPLLVNITKTTKVINNINSPDKVSITDAELLYWPNNHNSSGPSKNITAIILEKENKKAKLNVSKETLRENHTQALEHAIFGEVNWNDVDTIAPTFMSFVGKYIKGALTFCSENICHSMKCAQKNCVHRICLPEDRINNKGHCAGSNNTDSVVSMESIMDLPSNIAFEIVDILNDKMLGKLFGKATLCIRSKCITFAASKKMFTKSKCNIKDLDIDGQCMNTKGKKNM